MNLVTPDSVKAYLVRSLQRKIIRQLKSIRSKEKKIGIIPEIQVDYSVEEQIIAYQFMDEQQNRVTKALDVLTKRQKEAVYLKFYGNLSYKEISTQMAISADSVYNLVSKAIDSLQQDLT